MTDFSEKKAEKFREEANKFLVQRWEPRPGGPKPIVMTKGEGIYM